jgi:hypothetical protein
VRPRLHSSLAVTTDGLPLGLTAVKFWNRDKFKGTAQLKRKINPTRVPIEAKESIRWLDNLRQSLALLGQPERCVHVGDRESDIYELYCLARDIGTHFVVRTVVDRLAGDGGHTVKSEMATSEIAILAMLVGDGGNRGARPGTLLLYLTKLARLGGYLARMSDPLPGNTFIWRGLRRLADIQLGAEIGQGSTRG